VASVLRKHMTSQSVRTPPTAPGAGRRGGARAPSRASAATEPGRRPAAQALYIRDGDEGSALFAIFHEPAQPAHDVAVLMCPPFGWEDMCSYRARREWADSLAGDGFAVLRIDLPGSGDSPGSPHDPERVRAWTNGVDIAARWLSNATGARRIAAIGIGLGGAIAYNALVAGAPIDDLVLWGTSARGKMHLRELRAFSYMESPAEPDAETPATVQDTDDGSLAVAGYVLSEETQRELQELDLAELPAARLGSAHVLLLERDGRPVDARLKSAIEGHGAKLTVGEGDGYAAMMMAELPHSVSAHAVFDGVSEWLLEEVVATEAGANRTPGDGEPPRGESSTEISMPDGTRVRETPITIEHPLGNPIGILTEPVGPAVGLCAVWLNAGPQRRIGPNRMWVEAARRWAAQGVPSFRVDLAAIGDADGDSRKLLEIASYYTDGYLDQVRLVLDTLEARGLTPRFILGGLCAGAYWSLRIAQEDTRVSAAAALNPGYVVYDGGLSNAIGQSRELGPRLLERSTWARVLRGQFTPSSHLRALRTILMAMVRRVLRLPRRILSPGAGSENEVTQLFDLLREQDQHALILFAGEERLHRELLAGGRLTGLERWPNISVEHVPMAGDMHTLRPPVLQREGHRLLDELLQGELARISADGV
jgi:pimeloyl-ACP methyl ester carboxylesterase